MTSRRTFLRVLGAAVVGAVVAPSLPIPTIAESSPPNWWRSATDGPSPPLSLELLQEAFNKCSRGGTRGPTHLVTSRAVADSYARMCGLVYDLDIAA